MVAEIVHRLQSDPHASRVLDAAAAVPVAGAFVGTLPDWAALVGMIWYVLQIWEGSKTVRAIRHRVGEWWRKHV